ncbi:MAG: hypothetical protein V7L20_18670 [Nostoc sp.]|uniref:hypothetical protein n=1 Tax=Nostoc sp. TaxID=1180 RepID=UPI002FFBC993
MPITTLKLTGDFYSYFRVNVPHLFYLTQSRSRRTDESRVWFKNMKTAVNYASRCNGIVRRCDRTVNRCNDIVSRYNGIVRQCNGIVIRNNGTVNRCNGIAIR